MSGPSSRRQRWIAEHGRPSPCPHCGSADTERTAPFGPFHMAEAYFCRSCRSPFSRIRWEPGPSSGAGGSRPRGE